MSDDPTASPDPGADGTAATVAVDPSSLDEARVLHENDRHIVYEVGRDDRRVVWKVARTDDAADRLDREVAVHRVVEKRTPLPAPEVLSAGEDRCLVAWCDGDGYDAEDRRSRRRKRVRAVGTTLARLHEATEGWFDGHGDLTVVGDGSVRRERPLAVADPRPWDAVFADRVRAWVDRLPPTFAAAGGALLEAVLEHRDALVGRNPVLVHGDLAPEHVRFDGDDLAGVFDFERSAAAPGEFDLVTAELGWFESPHSEETDGSLRSALREGYEAVRSLGPGFERRRALYRAAITLQYLPQAERLGAETGDDELTASMRSYVFDRLDDAEEA